MHLPATTLNMSAAHLPTLGCNPTTHLSMNVAGPSESRSYRCDKCPKTYNRRDYLERHALNHEKPMIRCDRCGKAFTRHDVLRKHQREACKGPTSSRSSGEVHVEPPRKRVRTSTRSSECGTVHTTPERPATAQPDARGGGLDMTLAPALAFEDVASTPQPGVDRGWTLPARAESALGVRNPVALSSGWNGAAPLLDSVDDIIGWLFNTSTDSDTLLYEAASFGTDPDGSNGNDAPLQNLVGGGGIHTAPAMPAPLQGPASAVNTSPSRPVNFHPYNIRNEPLRQAHFLPNDSVPREWEMPAPKPIFTEDIRRQILDIYEGELREEIAVVFTLQRMTLFMELYFMHFAPLYPIIHRPSLGYRTLSPDLLLAIICIGTAYAADRQSFELAARMSKKIRDRIFEKVEEEPRLDIQSLQIILQINHFSRSYCSLKQHDVSQIFHSPSITLARLSGVFAPK
ncbi:hypothetical protein DB88DRAFT_222684 [Papiliotrema laurentii]|uniref:C2H2-type domain-containing protein n=1 Tax=Papiliotrema laurentii TaxID=5418 RepID=A0AAD9FTF9_PAPLA|nr:hypothetical protein DB88DRAFT_222684 [Papiliotrema laurentii]